MRLMRSVCSEGERGERVGVGDRFGDEGAEESDEVVSETESIGRDWSLVGFITGAGTGDEGPEEIDELVSESEYIG